jgi:hypothetical protein
MDNFFYVILTNAYTFFSRIEIFLIRTNAYFEYFTAYLNVFYQMLVHYCMLIYAFLVHELASPDGIIIIIIIIKETLTASFIKTHLP